MKTVLVVFLLLSSLPIQVWSQAVEDLIRAEKSFEKTCHEKGLQEGFLSHADSSGITFSRVGPVNAIAYWLEQGRADGFYSWSPAIAEISASGDWGYTTGPYEYRMSSLDDTVSNSGQYTTVWKKSSHGQWKYILDIGNGHPHTSLDGKPRAIQCDKQADPQATNDSLMHCEQNFIEEFENSPRVAYQKFGAEEYVLNLGGHTPVLSTADAVELLLELDLQPEYHPVNSALSPGKDMAMVYGTLVQGEKKSNYLRIWRSEPEGWRIALEVIQH